MDIQFRTILCAIDFSEYSHHTVEYGVGLCKSFGARFLVFHSVHVSEDQLFASPFAEHEEEVQRLADLALKKIEKLMEPYDVDWVPAVTKGNPVDKVEETAAQAGADLVMAVSHGFSGIKRFLLGTVVERMARGLNRPFLIIPPKKRSNLPDVNFPFSIKKVIVGCDLTPDISPAMEYARYFATKFNSEIHLVHTMESPVNEEIVDKTEGPYDKVQQVLRQRLADKLLNMVPKKTDEELKVRAVVKTGIPGEALIRYSKTQTADLVIVGIRRHGPIEKILVGSTTEAVIRHSPCPVLVVSPNVLPSKP